jgi:hypothetical protein
MTSLELLLLPPHHHPELHNFSQVALTSTSSAGIVAGISGSQPMNLYPFLLGSDGGVIGLP